MRGPRRLVARNRRRLAQSVWRLALGPASGTVARTVVASIARQSWHRDLAPHVEDVELLSASHIQRFDFAPPLPVRFRATQAFEDRYRYRLRNVCVSPGTGLAWLDGGPILGESVGPLRRLMGSERWMLEEPLLRPRRTIEGTVVTLPPVSYYHWVLEALPCALHALAAEPDATLLLPRGMPRYAEETVELLGFRNVVRADEPVVAERLVLVAREPFVSWIRRADLDVVRDALLPRVGAPADPAAGVYVSRRLARRSPLNEADLERAAERCGLRVACTETMSFPDQVALLSTARVVAGAHGAGLTNLVFAERPERLVELIPVDFFRDCYARLAVQLGASYASLTCEGPGLAQSFAPVQPFEDALRNGRAGVDSGS